MTLHRRQGARSSLRKRNAKKARCPSEEALQIAWLQCNNKTANLLCEKKEEKPTKKEKRKNIPIRMQSSKEQQGEIRKPSLVISAKKYRRTIEWEKLEISSRKLEIPKEHFMQRWAQ